MALALSEFETASPRAGFVQVIATCSARFFLVPLTLTSCAPVSGPRQTIYLDTSAAGQTKAMCQIRRRHGLAQCS